MNLPKYITLLLLVTVFTIPSNGQTEENRRVWASGYARSVFQQNDIDVDNDTVTPRQLNSGHALVDLAINARPNDQTFLHGMVRIRNDFGGFWGAGITFDIRQLYVKGLINNAIRYQLGDFNYKLTPYTFYNNNEELSEHQLEGLSIFSEMVQYDLFYNFDNSWRQQGAAVDFALEFDQGIDEIQFNVFGSRNRTTDFAMQSDRVFFGGNVTLIQSPGVSLGANYIDLMDIVGTSSATTQFHNPVFTGTVDLSRKFGDFDLGIQTESGMSQMYTIDASIPKMQDFFYDLSFTGEHKKTGLGLTLNYVNVGPQFRSVGAQSKRVNFNSVAQIYSQYTNEQVTRPINQLDLYQDVSLYQINLTPGLQRFSPIYDNVTPYGKATPNRKGLNAELEHTSKSEIYNVSVGFSSLSEVVGQGTDDLRTFNVLNARGLISFDKFLAKWNKPLELSLGYRSISTQRSTAYTEADIDLSTTILDIGAKVGLVSDFELIANYRSVQADGNELLSVRDGNTEVIDFQSFNTSLSENILLIGIRYNFSEENTLDINWQKLDWEDKDRLDAPYSISQFAIVYRLKF